MPARFGFPPYGGSITQNVYYVDDKKLVLFSFRSSPRSHSPHTKRWTISRTTLHHDDRSMGMHICQHGKTRRTKLNALLFRFALIVLSQLNACMQVRNAQKNGAAALLIANRRCSCYDTECGTNTPNPNGCTNPTPMLDDGSGVMFQFLPSWCSRISPISSRGSSYATPRSKWNCRGVLIPLKVDEWNTSCGVAPPILTVWTFSVTSGKWRRV